MSVILQGWDQPAAPLSGGLVAAPAPPAPLPILDWGWWWGYAADYPANLTLSWEWWWASVAPYFPWPAVAARAPATWWNWWWAAPVSVPARQYGSGRGLAHGRYTYQSSAGAGEGDRDMAAAALPPTPHTVLLRSHDKFVPFTIDFARDVGTSDGVSAYSITVWAQPLEQEGVAAADVTASLLMGQSSTDTQVTAILCNANAQPGTQYSVRVVATMASGLTLEQTIGDGPQSRIICDR